MNLKETQVIQTISLEEIIALKAKLISWIGKWDVLRGKKLKRHNMINRFRDKLNEARVSVPIRFSVKLDLKKKT